MKKLINDPSNYVDEVIEGMCLAYPNQYTVDGETSRVLRRPHAVPNKVGVVSGGGFGHLPIFAGYVGEGLLDVCAIGDVFASPDIMRHLIFLDFSKLSMVSDSSSNITELIALRLFGLFNIKLTIG